MNDDEMTDAELRSILEVVEQDSPVPTEFGARLRSQLLARIDDSPTQAMEPVIVEESSESSAIEPTPGTTEIGIGNERRRRRVLAAAGGGLALVAASIAVAFFLASGGDGNSLETEDLPTATSVAPTSTIAPNGEQPGVVVPTDPQDSNEEPGLSMDIEVNEIGPQFVRFRFSSQTESVYTTVIRHEGEVVATGGGTAMAGEVQDEHFDNLQIGARYSIQVTLIGPPPVTSSEVAFRTAGPSSDEQGANPIPVEIEDLRATDLQPHQFQFDYQTNICANGTFIILEEASSVEVGRNNGLPEGCVDTHLGVPGMWTPALIPDTSYIVIVTVEAHGAGLGGGNTSSESLIVRTPPRPIPDNPIDIVTDQVEILEAELAETEPNQFRVDYTTNVCANGSFVVLEEGAAEVGRHDGRPQGCATEHSAIPGLWTPALQAETNYVLLITAEADGAGLGNGNIATVTISARTQSEPETQPGEFAEDPVTFDNVSLRDVTSSSFSVDYSTNVCTNGAYVIFGPGAEEIARDGGETAGCATEHTVQAPDELTPDTNYVVLLTAEANGSGLGNGNISSTTLEVLTASG